MTEFLIGLAAFLLGLMSGWLLAERRAARAAAQQQAVLQQLENAFGKLAGDALHANSASFLLQAADKMAPLAEELKKLEQRTAELEGKRERAYGALETHLGELKEATARLRSDSSALAEALRGSSKVRGNLGETLLRNVVELAGMTPHCDFDEQLSVAGGRIDLVVRLPGGGGIPVDAKFPLSSYYAAVETRDPAEEKRRLEQHGRDLRTHVLDLARRDYPSKLPGGADFTVLFLPGEHLLTAAHGVAPELFAEALEKRVLIVTPVTLLALLRTVALYWQQQTIAEDARKVWEAAQEYQERVRVFTEHLRGLGEHLGKAIGSFNKAVASFETRVEPSARKLETLQAPKQPRQPPQQVAELPRSLAGGEERGGS